MSAGGPEVPGPGVRPPAAIVTFECPRCSHLWNQKVPVPVAPELPCPRCPENAARPVRTVQAGWKQKQRATPPSERRGR
jgi:hypothetical protein